MKQSYKKGEKLQIANQGGVIDFSIVVNNLGAITYNENEPIKVDGTLLKQIGIELKEESFDKIEEIIKNASDSKELAEKRKYFKEEAWNFQDKAGSNIVDFMISKDL